MVTARAVIGISVGKAAIEAAAPGWGSGIQDTAGRVDFRVVPRDAGGWHIGWRTGYGHIELPGLPLVLLFGQHSDEGKSYKTNEQNRNETKVSGKLKSN